MHLRLAAVVTAEPVAAGWPTAALLPRVAVTTTAITVGTLILGRRASIIPAMLLGLRSWLRASLDCGRRGGCWLGLRRSCS